MTWKQSTAKRVLVVGVIAAFVGARPGGVAGGGAGAVPDDR
jgi:hypothetical protein